MSSRPDYNGIENVGFSDADENLIRLSDLVVRVAHFCVMYAGCVPRIQRHECDIA